MDPTIEELRRRISERDRAVLDAVNERVRLVSELKAYKESQGIEFLDPDREARMLADLREANTGPLGDEGVRELLRALLDLTRREL